MKYTHFIDNIVFAIAMMALLGIGLWVLYLTA